MIWIPVFTGMTCGKRGEGEAPSGGTGGVPRINKHPPTYGGLTGGSVIVSPFQGGQQGVTASFTLNSLQFYAKLLRVGL